MKRIITSLIFTGTVLCYANLLVAQDAKQENKESAFSNPETNSPISISVDESDAQAMDNIGWCGFSAAYFHKGDVEALLSTSKCVGVRVYNAKEGVGQSYADLIMVAIDKDGNEIGASPNYVLSKALDVNGNLASNKVTNKYSKTCVSNLDVSNSFVVYTSYFSKTTVSGLLTQSNCTGVKIKPADEQFTVNGTTEVYRTMSIGAANVNNSKLTELGSSYQKSAEPCPTACGTSGGKYLWER